MNTIVNIAGFHLGIENPNSVSATIGHKYLEDFFIKENCLTLFATLFIENFEKKIAFFHAINNDEDYKKLIVFYKNHPCVLNDDNIIETLQVTSLSGSPTTALYNTLQNVFTPLLVQNNKKATNTNLQKQLINFQTGLRNTLITNTKDFDPLNNSLESLSITYTLENEVDYWQNAANSAKTKELRASSQAFKEILEPLARDFSVLDALPLNDIEDLLENAHNVLDDLWRRDPPFPKARIQHLMDLIASEVERCVLKNVHTINIWESEYNDVLDLLNQCATIVQRWKSTCTELTQIFWPNYSLHAWTGGPYIPQNLLDLKKRLEEVLNVRTIHKQLIRLLTTSEEKDLKVNEMFRPFTDFDIFDCGSHTESIWRTATKKFEYLIEPAEQKVAMKLKEQLSNMNTGTRQLLHEYGRYSELISRPVVRKILLNERQSLLVSLKKYVQELGNQIGSEVPKSLSKFDTPKIISEIIFTRQLDSKAKEVQKISTELLTDLEGYEDLEHGIVELIKDVKIQHNELFDSWTSEMTEKIRNNTLSLKQTDSVVKFDSNKMMHVNYSPNLVNLIQEVRQLSAMGYRIPNVIETTSKTAEKFVKHAKILEQIAHFHNTVGDLMIPSQRPMMLKSAVELSELVQEQEVVSWSDVDAVEKYVDTLKQAVEKLWKENNTLTSFHTQIIDKLEVLKETDLIKYYQKWKEVTKSVRDIVTQVENKGFKNTTSWKSDIDQKLSKIMEEQYINSFDTLHLYLPEIQADLVYHDSQLQLSPNEEKLKEKYNQQLRRFLDLPKNFRGISDYSDKNVFAEIVDRNQDALSKINVYTEKLFEQLRGVVKHWQTWITLDPLDVSKFTSWEHWDLHFRASKTFGQEIAKLPSTEEKVGCFLIGLSWLRSDLEAHNRSYWSQLVASLKESIAQDVFKLQQYVDTSTGTLHKQPVTLDQIGEADASHADILRQKPEMEDLYKEMMRKSNLLASWSRDRVDSVNRLQTAWERLHNLLDNHEHIIAKQVETMKINLNINSENLHNDIERFAAKWEQVKPRPNSGQISEESLPELLKHLENIKEKRVQWNKLMEIKNKLISDYTKFGMQLPDFQSFEKIQNDLVTEEESWLCFDEFYTDLQNFGQEEWIVFRKKIYKLEDFLTMWQTKLESLQSTALVTRLLQEIHNYQSVLPLLKYVRGEDFTENHWMEVFNLLKMTPKPIDLVLLKDFLDVSDALMNNTKELQAICKRSASEVVVRQALIELDQWEVQSRFELIPHEDSNKKSVLLIKDFKEILSKIGDNQSLLQSVKNSADYESFMERASIWEKRLLDLDNYLTSLAQIQRKWIYLEPIFGRGTLGHEKLRFDRLDKDFKQIMKFIEKDSRVTTLCRYQNLRSLLETIQEQLSRCQHSLDEFLTEKRNKFPRFLFLGDDDLLEVVGQSSKEQVIQNHLKKLFAGIHSIKLTETGDGIEAMCSLEGEQVPLINPIDINQPVENWLNNLVTEMQSSLKNLLKKCLADGQNADPLKYPSQILCLADSITFTNKCEKSITNMSLSTLLNNYKSQLNHYSSLELNETNDNSLLSLNFNENQEDDSNLLDIKLKSLLLDTIHHINVIEELIQGNVTKITDWSWQKQLRFYSNNSGEVTAKMVNAEMEYSFEYLGNQAKLVRTPLTDKCFLTLTQGMHLGMGGNPYGPAGTGKTESVKALGNLLGRKVLVFNCDEGIDSNSMGRILSGLVRCGAWGCFDEFNRLDEATLSAISMHIQLIQNALKTKLDKINLVDQEIQVNKHCGIFVTLNPAGGNYGARNKLPDNLKQLFRPVVMTHPDHEQIARTLLLCDGYKNGALIGRKLIETFLLSSELLSKQQHYDWGLRALRTVLSGCGRIIRKKRKESSEISMDQEMHLVVKALRTDTLSKLTYSDSIKFGNLIKDVFPGVNFEESDSTILLKALEESYTELGLRPNNRQINKCLELYEQLRQRMGVVIVGPPSSGKTTICILLFKALSILGRKMIKHIFNPKSMPRSQLLGQINMDTRQWTDGVLTLYSLKVTSEPLDVWSWIIADGDIDPEWIESLNSVLDDNRLLSLPSGWRIQFGPNVNFVFETHDLSNASPATISRMGIVFLSEEDVNLEDFIESFVARKNLNIQGMIEDYFLKSVNYIYNEEETLSGQSKLALCNTGLSHIENALTKSQFIIGLINGLGGSLTDESRENFTKKIFEWANEQPSTISSYYRYNKERDVIDVYNNEINYNNDDNRQKKFLSLCPTAKIRFYLDCVKPWLRSGNEQNFLIVGPHGSAKTFLLQYALKDRNDIDICTIHCTANLTPQHVIQQFTQYCMVVSSNKGRVYKPKKGNLILYLKNMHLLKCDRWGSNTIIAFLQQIVSYGGLFDTNLDWVGVENVTIVGTLDNVNNISERFLSTFHLLFIGLPSQTDLISIFSGYLSQLLPNSQIWTKNKINKLTTTMVSIYNNIQQTFPPVQQRHYTITPYDLTLWCQSVLRHKFDNTDKNIERQLLDVICYESLRLFRDKMVHKSHREKIENLIFNTFQTQWNISNIAENLLDIFYVPVIQPISNKDTVILSRLDKKEWADIVNKGINLYEREGEDLNVTTTPELLHLTSVISKSLTVPQGSIFLIGRAGIGRKSALKIVSALQNAKLIIPTNSNRTNFINDLKMAMQKSGLDGEEVYLLFEDHLLRPEFILDYLNTLLCSGEVPGLYNSTELESLISGLKDEIERENYDGNLLQFFIERVRKHLHIIVCLEVDNVNFTKILQTCPSLYQKCTVIWMSEWSNETLIELPTILIKKLQNDYNEEETSKDFAQLHSLVNSKIAVPTRYISLIRTYSEIYSQKKYFITNKQNKLQAGVSKLTEAKTVVAELKKNAVEQQEKLSEKQSKANAALDMISNTMKNANNQKEEMEVLKHQTEEESVKLARRKKEIEAELAEVKPLIEQARSAVGNIKTEALSEIRSLRAPPDVIRDILEGVLRLMGTQDTSWNSMKTFLARRGVKEDIRSFDASRINPDSRRAVEKLMTTRSDSFDPKNAKRASVAAAPLAAWVTANVRYSKVLDNIKPLEKEQNKLKRNLNDAELQLEELSSGLSDVDATVAKLKSQLATYTKEAAEIEIHLGAAQETLKTAEELVEKLGDEYERWKTQLNELATESQKLHVNSLLSSAFITYLAAESEDERINILTQWLKALGQEEFSIEKFMSMEQEQLQWQSEGLAVDQLSIQNAIIILNSQLYPLLLDPTSRSVKWIQKHLQDKNVEVISQNSSKFNTALELAVRFGKVLIIEEVEDVNPILFPILRRQYIIQGERKLIKLNGKLMDFHNDFQLIFCCRNTYLKLSTDLSAYICIVNFTTTHASLTEQLLTGAIKQESPHLEERRRNLLSEREKLQEKLSNFQNQLLEDLVNATGNILQNTKLMTSLNETKSSSNAISEALIESKKIEQKLQEEYEVYKDVASFGSVLYFAVEEFSQSNILYSISVPAFIRLFLTSLQGIGGPTDGFVQRNLLQHLYNFVGRGIFKSDRLKFALYLVYKSFPNLITENEWTIFVGKLLGKTSDPLKTDIPSWIPEKFAQSLYTLQATLPGFYNSLKLIVGNSWKNFMEKLNCEAYFPSNLTITEFQKVLVIQLLRPDRLHTAMLQCVLRLTGLSSLNPTVIQLSQIFKESLANEPILLITTSGTDPSVEIRELAYSQIGEERYVEIAMGEGQEPKAIEALLESAAKGKWLLLKNLHLVTTWLPILSQNVQNLNPHDNFRLWLITEQHQLFNPVLAQNSLKVAYEIPQGIKNNLLRSYTQWGREYIEKLNPTAAKIFFSLACVHAILQERRTYIPQGWSKFYEFSDNDLSTAIKLTEELWQSQNFQGLWKFLNGLCADAIYGGRIENIQDFSVLESYLRQYCTEEILSHRWKPLESKHSLPSYANFEDYINLVNNLSNHDLPSYFGLPENINRAWEKNTATAITLQLRDFGRKNSESNLPEEWQKNIAPYLVLWKKLNQGQEFVKMSLPMVKNDGSPIEMFLSNEFYTAIDLIQKIHLSFATLNKMSKNAAAIDETGVVFIKELINHSTPKTWIKIWNGPKDPIKYLKIIMNNTASLSKWNNNENVLEFLRSPISLSQLFNPKAFLSAAKQNISRFSSIPMDQLTIRANWKGAETNNSIQINGLLVEGGLFDGYNLVPCNGTSENLSAAPTCYITWIKEEEILENENVFQVPLYYSVDRDEILTHLPIPCGMKERDKWIQAGLAFFVSV